MSEEIHISGLILAGGAGTRVRGCDKGLLQWQDEPLVAHVANRLGPQVDQLIISCNRNVDIYKGFAQFLSVDTRPDFQGPLAGIEAAAEQLRGDVLIVVACDTPLLPQDLVKRLLEPLASADVQISYASDGTREQYLFSAIRISCLESLTDYLDSGQRAVRHWYQMHRTAVVDFSDQSKAFANFNTLEYPQP